MSIPLCPLKSQPVAPVAGTRALATSGERAAAPETKRTVAISAAARQLASLSAADGDVDAARVDAIRAALAAGIFSVDTSRIADGLLASARELIVQDTHKDTP